MQNQEELQIQVSIQWQEPYRQSFSHSGEDCLASKQEKLLVIQSTNVAYLDQSFSHSPGQLVVAPPVVGQLSLGRSQPSVGQPVIPSLHCCPPAAA